MAHFAHKRKAECAYGKGESEVHRRCKAEIFEELLKHPAVTRLQLERNLKTVRPDISCYIHGYRVAIEVQISSLPIETVMKRTKEYHRMGIYLLWLGQWNDSLASDRYSPRLWERWVHAAYFGRIFFWKGGLNIFPYRLNPHRLPGSRDYHNLSSSPRGVAQRSKRFRLPVEGKALHLIDDFRPLIRNAWSNGFLTIPEARLYTMKDTSFEATEDFAQN